MIQTSYPLTIGTAGHIDHGKTALVKALTGIETDRLKAEKERGITIELGYAYMTLRDYKIGLVDVPGHERLIRTMIAGATGIDAVLFVMAADEGVKPQTLEHLKILHYAGIKNGILVITKKDLVTEQQMQGVKESFYKVAQGTFMENATCYAVSIFDDESIQRLRGGIIEMAEHLKDKLASRLLAQLGAFRMPIDRHFSLSGIGTIVAGTVAEGRVDVTNQLMLYPKGLICKVRSLEVHHETALTGVVGQRVAMNITGVDFNMIHRGDVLAFPGALKPTSRIEAYLELTGEEAKKVQHFTRLRLYIGAKEVLCRLVLLEENTSDTIKQHVQLRLEEEIVCRQGDPFVIRSYSPLHTLGGGVITKVHSKPTRRSQLSFQVRHTTEAVNQIEETLEVASEAFLHSGKLPTREQLILNTGQNESVCLSSLEILKQNGGVIEILEGYLSNVTLDYLGVKLIEALGEFHKKFPLQNGMGKEAIRARIFNACRVKIFDELLNIYLKKDMIVIQGQSIALSTFRISLNREQQKKEERFLKLLYNSGYMLKTATELFKLAGFESKDKDLSAYILSSSDVVGLEEGLVIHRTWLGDAKSKLTAYLEVNGSIDAAGYRDLMQTNRKVAIALLEYFDASQLTQRVDNKRQLKML